MPFLLLALFFSEQHLYQYCGFSFRLSIQSLSTIFQCYLHSLVSRLLSKPTDLERKTGTSAPVTSSSQQEAYDQQDNQDESKRRQYDPRPPADNLGVDCGRQSHSERKLCIKMYSHLVDLSECAECI